MKRADPLYSLALKILTNSLYGSLGFPQSRLYSPRCVAATTSIGRYLIEVSGVVMSMTGLQVVGGDTDSCFVKATRHTVTHFGSDLHRHVQLSLSLLERILSFTPFGAMRMDVKEEETYRSLLLVKKKMYCGVTVRGEYVSRGISNRRIDRLGVVRKAVDLLIPIIHEEKSLRQRQTRAAGLLVDLLHCIEGGRLPVEDKSKQIRKGGSTRYVFVDARGYRVQMDCSKTPPETCVRFHAHTVASALVTACESILVLAGLGLVRVLIEWYYTAEPA